MRTVGLAGALLSLACAVPLAHAVETRALVVVNDNSLDSQLIGNEYSIQRDVPDDHIVHVLSPNSYFVSTADFFSLRDQILRFGLCPLVAADKRPAACADMGQPIYTDANVKLLTDNASVSYIVMTRGVPTRFVPPDGSNESASVDAYLHYWLARYFDDSTDPAMQFDDRAAAYGTQRIADGKAIMSTDYIGQKLRPTDPKLDREYIIGRIDNVDRNSAMKMIGKTISAETNGIYGKVYTNLGWFESTYGSGQSASGRGPGFSRPLANGQAVWIGDNYTLSTFNETRPECASLSTNYLSIDEDPLTGAVPASGVSPWYCEVKFSRGRDEGHDQAPGMAGSRQPLVDNALVYFGTLDGQSPQGGFDELKNWRKNSTCSNTVCDTAADPVSCRNASRDVAKVLDTSCVGVPSGAIGFNLRSYPAAWLGLWPKGWVPQNPNSEIELPSVAQSNGSLVFDGSDEPASPQCWRYGSDKLLSMDTACASGRRLNVAQTVQLGTTLASSYTVSYKVMTKGLRAPSKIMTALEWHVPTINGTCPSGWSSWGGAYCMLFDTKLVDLGPSDTWQTVTVTFPAPSGMAAGNNSATLSISAPQIHNYPFDGLNPIPARTASITAVSMSAAGSSTNLVVNGSFNDADQYAHQTGDYNWASSFLGRLGGTAFWGSIGHHGTGGHSFENQETRILHQWLHGLPLGDAVWLLGSGNAAIFYGDPLYNPVGLRMIPAGGMSGGHFLAAFKMQGTAYNGSADTASGAQLAVCPMLDVSQCDSNNLWVNLPKTSASLGGYVVTSLPGSSLATYFPNYGSYAIRMNVNFTHPTTGETIALNDFFNVAYGYADSEIPHYGASGSVKDAAGAAIKGVNVTFTNAAGGPAGTAYSSATGDYGVATVLAPGRYTVAATAPGYTLQLKSGGSQVTVVDADLTGIDFVATASAPVITGAVSWVDGNVVRPADGIRVVAKSNGTVVASSRSSSNGSYALSGLVAGDYSIEIDASKSVWPRESAIYATGWTAPATAVALSTQSKVVNVTLTALSGNWLAGTLKHPDGSPSGDDALYVTNCVDGKSYYAMTNKDGVFRLNGLAATGSSATASCPVGKVSVSSDGYVYNGSNVYVTAQTMSTNTLGQVVVQQSAPAAQLCNTSDFSTGGPGCSITGYVLSASTGQAMLGVSITLTRASDGLVRTVSTDASGRYSFTKLGGGSYVVRATNGAGTSVSVTLTGQNKIGANLNL